MLDLYANPPIGPCDATLHFMGYWHDNTKYGPLVYLQSATDFGATTPQASPMINTPPPSKLQWAERVHKWQEASAVDDGGAAERAVVISSEVEYEVEPGPPKTPKSPVRLAAAHPHLAAAHLHFPLPTPQVRFIPFSIPSKIEKPTLRSPARSREASRRSSRWRPRWCLALPRSLRLRGVELWSRSRS